MVDPQTPIVPSTSFWEPIEYGGRDRQRHPLWLCRCKKCGEIVPVREEFIRNGRSMCCKSCSSRDRWQSAPTDALDAPTAAVTPKPTDNTADIGSKNSEVNHAISVKGNTSPDNGPPRHKFSKAFLKSLDEEEVTVAELARIRDGLPTCFKQPPPVEKILKAEGLELGTGMAPRDDDGTRGDNLILVGDGPDVDQAIKNDKADRRVGPSGVNPNRYYDGEPSTRPTVAVSIRLKFGRAYHKPKIRKMLCSTHGEQIVVKHNRKTFFLECGCKRSRAL